MTVTEPLPPDTAAVSSECQEPGLWLWRGAVPTPREAAPLTLPAAPGNWIAHLFGSVAQRMRWLALPNRIALGLAVLGLAAFVALTLLHSGEAIPTNAPAAALQPLLSPVATRPASPVLPGSAVASPDATVAQTIQTAPLSAPIAERMAERTKAKTIKWRASRRSHLGPRRRRAFLAYRWPAFWEPCRYQCDWIEPMTWHGGGY